MRHYIHHYDALHCDTARAVSLHGDHGLPSGRSEPGPRLTTTLHWLAWPVSSRRGAAESTRWSVVSRSAGRWSAGLLFLAWGNVRLQRWSHCMLRRDPEPVVWLPLRRVTSREVEIRLMEGTPAGGSTDLMAGCQGEVHRVTEQMFLGNTGMIASGNLGSSRLRVRNSGCG
jgi:hypothetical protein